MRTLSTISFSMLMRNAGEEWCSGRKSCRNASSISRKVDPGTTDAAGIPTAFLANRRQNEGFALSTMPCLSRMMTPSSRLSRMLSRGMDCSMSGVCGGAGFSGDVRSVKQDSLLAMMEGAFMC